MVIAMLTSKKSKLIMILVLLGLLLLLLPLPLLIFSIFNLEKRYLRYSIDVLIDGTLYSYSQNIECINDYVFRESKMIFEHQWRGNGTGPVAKSIDKDRILFFSPDADRFLFEAHSLKRPVELLVERPGRTKIYAIDHKAINPDVEIKRIYLEPLDSKPERIGPSDEDQRFTESVLEKYQTAFEQVTAQIMPYSLWSQLPRCCRYFSELTSITIATETPEHKRNVFRLPYAYERAQLMRANQGLVPKISLSSNGKVYEMPLSNTQTFFACYYAAEGKTEATVNYKNNMFTLRRSNEVYDPETQEIIRFNYEHFYHNLRALIDGVTLQFVTNKSL